MPPAVLAAFAALFADEPPALQTWAAAPVGAARRLADKLHDYFTVDARLRSKAARGDAFVAVRYDRPMAKAFGKRLVAVLAEGDPDDDDQNLPRAVAAA